MEVNYHEIGERILQRRKEFGLTQERLSEQTGISINQISNLENSRSVPSVETILKLCEALKVTPDYFLLGITKNVNENAVKRIAELAQLSSDKQQNFIYEFISLLHKEDY